jgi:ATP adenylyltransferase
LEKLWSPWRSNYIDSFKNPDKDGECVFCTAQKLSAEDPESLLLYKGSSSFLMMNLFPYNNGHLMIIPNRHISDYLDLSSPELNEIFELNKKAMTVLRKIMYPHGFNFGANIGKAAGAGIHEHLHFHLVPRWNGDTNFMPVLGEVKIISQDLIETKNKFIAEFNSLEQ